MKTKFRFSGIFAIILSLFMFSATPPKKAPCPFKVVNTLACAVTINVRVADTTCSSYCGTYFNVTVPAGGTYSIPCTGCSGICNIIVTVLKIGGTSVGLDVTFTSGAIPLPAVCGATQVVYNPGSTSFIIS